MTNRITLPAVGLLLGMALMLGLAAAPANAAKQIPVNLRVVSNTGKIIFDRTIKTGTAKVTPNSTCPTLNGRKGPARTVAGPTAIGLLSQGAQRNKELRPLRISDSDYGFGVCGIGGTMAQGEGWWVLRHNNKDAMSGAEGLKLKRNDSVLFYYSTSWQNPTPNTLFLKAQAKAKKGAKIKVRVFAYDGAGKRSPVAGAKVSGAKGALTDAKGFTKLTITRKTRLVARQGNLIPSNRVAVAIRK